MSILVVDDEQVALTSYRRLLKRRGFKDVDICADGNEAIGLIRNNDYDVVLLDILMPGVDGLQVLEATKPHKPRTEFIILTAVDDIATAVKTVRLGAYDYLAKPLDNERLLLSIERAFERKGLRAAHTEAFSRTAPSNALGPFHDIVTQCSRIKELLSFAQVMARSGNPILITGESGTGKELLARGIHRAGPSPEGPFVAVNLSSIPDSLFESQIFGHAKGAFTGADRAHPGFFEQADGGTLFLDEIGELPMNLQVKLLRVLEEKTVIRLGETTPISTDVRIVSATNRNLEEACRVGRFRLDLMYRLNSAHIYLPPLRERLPDIPLLADHFLEKSCERFGKVVTGFTPEAMDILRGKSFEGNIRELGQLVEKAVLMSQTGKITPEDLGEKCPPTHDFQRRLSTLKENTESHILFVLRNTGGNRKETARILDISLRQLQRKLAEMREKAPWSELMGDI